MIKKQLSLLFALLMVLALCGCVPVVIDTTPSGASVYDDNETLVGNTPYKTDMFLSPRDYTVKMDGYLDESITVNSDSPKKINLDLNQKKVFLYSKPTAEVYPIGSDTSIGRTPVEIQIYEDARVYTLKVGDYYDQDITVDLESDDMIVTEMKLRPFVVISTSPDGVEVYENDKLIGTAPVREEILSSRTFEFKKKGYFSKTVTLEGAPPYEMNVELQPFPVITVNATPEGAEVYLGGKLQSKAPAKFAIDKKVTLEIRAPRHYSQTIDISPDSAKQTVVNLKAQPYVMITSEPSGAEVYIGNTQVGTTPVEQLIEKETEIELSKKGFVTQKTTLTGKNNQVTVSLKAVPVEPVVAPATNQTTAEADSDLMADEIVVDDAPVATPAEKPKSNSKYLIAILGAAAVAIAVVLLVFKRKN